jgi:RNA polymerase sigma-70 factor (ECF subfamily)
MTDRESHRAARDEAREVAAAVSAGDQAAFEILFERHRRELHVHCYRLLGSFQDAEDLVQETFLRAWRTRRNFERRSSFRTWLYRIATNACLDALERERTRPRPAEGAGGYGEIPWLQPYPDRLLEELVDTEAGPESTLVAKETIELAFLAAIQHLPPTQRAVLILRDVLGWSAKETASLLATSVPSANSALQRARETMQKRLPARRADWRRDPRPSKEERTLLRRYIEIHERADVTAFAELLSEDASFSMPPQPTWVVGRAEIMRFLTANGFGSPQQLGELRLLPVRANRQPGAANYVRDPGSSEFRAMALDVLRFEDGRLVEMTAFPPELFGAFGLPPTL